MKYQIENIKIDELTSKIEEIHETLKNLNSCWSKKYYNTREVSKLTGIGKSVIDKLRQNGEITYSKIGQTFVYTIDDIDELMRNNQIKCIS